MHRVLVIEDDPDISDIASIALRRAGYFVILARDGAEGESLMTTVAPDLILLDIAMPWRDGFQLLAAARKSPKLVATPIIMMTARNRAVDVDTALKLGASDYLVKPFNIEELVAKVRRGLTGRTAPRPASPPRLAAPPQSLPDQAESADAVLML